MNDGYEGMMDDDDDEQLCHGSGSIRKTKRILLLLKKIFLNITPNIRYAKTATSLKIISN